MICDIQKANWWKRLSAFLLDAILIVIISSGFCLLTAWIVDYDGINQLVQDAYTYYEETYGVSFSLTTDEYNALTEEEIAHYESVQEIINNDKEFMSNYRTLFILIIVIISVGCLFGVMIVEFVLPLIFKNGQTLGKKIFDLCVIREDSVRPTTMQLFIRAFIGKYVVEIMIPILLILLMLFNLSASTALLGLFVIAVIQIVMYITGKYHQVLHDRLSMTLVADKQSQMIFKTYDEMIKYKQEIAKKETEVAKSALY